MKKYLMLGLLILGACTAFKPKQGAFELKLMSMQAGNNEKFQVCEKQEEDILKKAISEVESSKSSDINISFPVSEKDALNFLNSFDFKKTDHQSEKEYFEYYLNNCSAEAFIKYVDFQHDRKICSSVFAEYKFFEGLIYGMQSYKWSAATQKRGREVLREYLHQLAEERSSFTSVLLGMSLVQSMSEGNLFAKKHKIPIEKIINKFENKRIEFVAEMKLAPPKDCMDEQDRYKREMQLAVEAGDSLLGLIKKYL